MEEDSNAERRRRQCRISQRRYRDKKGSAEYNLRLDVNSLRESVERLRHTRELLQRKISHDRRVLDNTVLKAVEQYFAVFANGLHDPDAGDHVRRCYELQLSFLDVFLAPDVLLGGHEHLHRHRGSGADALLEQWRRYTRFHASLAVSLDSASVVGSDTASPLVKARGHLSVRLTTATIEHLFPHVVGREDVVRRLVGPEIHYALCSEFVFDQRVQVVRHDFTVDFLTGLNRVLQDPFLTADVLQGARISTLGLLCPDDDSVLMVMGVGVRAEEEEEEEEEEKEEGSGGRPPGPPPPPPPSSHASSRFDVSYLMS
ncbi:hypothetical protein PINS_up017448 [Pythium insidiosum]|nr:hypothetical protein PINS_up017448 [Pythium insidiosum]